MGHNEPCGCIRATYGDGRVVIQRCPEHGGDPLAGGSVEEIETPRSAEGEARLKRANRPEQNSEAIKVAPHLPPITFGAKVVWGIPPRIKPLILGLSIAGKVRLRFRCGQAGKAFVRELGGIRCFVLEDRGDHWDINPKLEQGRNVRL